MVQVKPGLSKRISEGARICKGLSCGKFSKEKEGRSRGEGGEKRGKRYGEGRERWSTKFVCTIDPLSG